MSSPAARPDGPLLVVGLGNPGPEYDGTRHNVGFVVVDALAGRLGARFSAHKRSGADVAEGRLAGRRAVLAKPRGYMNLSGGPVAAAARPLASFGNVRSLQGSPRGQLPCSYPVAASNSTNSTGLPCSRTRTAPSPGTASPASCSHRPNTP